MTTVIRSDAVSNEFRKNNVVSGRPDWLLSAGHSSFTTDRQRGDRGVRSDTARQEQNEQNDQDNPDDAGGPVTPASAMRPSGQDTQQNQHQDY